MLATLAGMTGATVMLWQRTTATSMARIVVSAVVWVCISVNNVFLVDTLMIRSWNDSSIQQHLL